MTFKLDENLPDTVIATLRRHGHEGVTARQQELKGVPDAVLHRACKDASEALITTDMDFADIRAYPPGTHPGILVLRLKRQSAPAVVRALNAYFSSRPSLLASELVIIEESRYRIRSA